MEKYITDKRTGLTYELVGDYYLVPMMNDRNSNQSESGDSTIGVISVRTSAAFISIYS